MAKTKAIQKSGESEKLSREQMRFNITMSIILALRDFFPKLLKYSVLIYLIFTLGDTMKYLAGKTSIAYYDIAFKFITDLDIGEWLAYAFGLIFGGGGISFAVRERKLRKRKTSYFTTRIRELEFKIDPNRSSSLLDPSGDTREGD